MVRAEPLGAAALRDFDLLLPGRSADSENLGTRLAARRRRAAAKRRRPERGLALTIERGLRAAAGAVVLVGAALAALQGPYWLLLTAFVGLNLLQSAFTNWCPMVWLLKWFGFRPCVAREEQGPDTRDAA